MSESKAVAKQNNLPKQIETSVELILPQLPDLLPIDITSEQFQTATYLELTRQYGIVDCSVKSVEDCIVKAATYGMMPGRDCHFLPFRDKRKGNQRQATFVPNYFGIIRTLDRTGKVAKAFAHAVYTNDEFEVDYFSDKPKHIPAATMGKKPGHLKCFYGAVLMKDGTLHFEVLTLEDIDAVKNRAPAHESGPWVSDYLMMARKTCIKRVAKYVQLTPEARQMLDEDEGREESDFNPDRGPRAAADLFGGNERDYKPEMYKTAQQEPPGEANGTEHDSQDAESNTGDSGASEGEFVAKVTHHCTNHDFDPVRVLAFGCCKWNKDHPNEFDLKQQGLVLNWLTTDGGRIHLKRQMEEKANIERIDAFLAGDDVPDPDLPFDAAESARLDQEAAKGE